MPNGMGEQCVTLPHPGACVVCRGQLGRAELYCFIPTINLMLNHVLFTIKTPVALETYPDNLTFITSPNPCCEMLHSSSY